MRLSLVVCLLLASAADFAQSAAAPAAAATTTTTKAAPITASTAWVTKSWFMKPHQAQYKKGEVDVKSNKDQDAALTVDKTNIAADANVEGKGDFNAKRTPNTEQIKVKNAKGTEVNVDQSKKASGLRTADTPKHHGQLQQTKTGTDTNVNLAADTSKTMDTAMHGDKQSFDANGSRGNKQNLTPQSQSKTSGSGVITRNGEKYNYQESKAATGDTTAQLSNVGQGTARKTYTCQGQKTGISNCVDQNGLKVGEVVSQPDGTVIVKKTLTKGVDVAVGKGKVTKGTDGKNTVSLNDGLYQAQSGNYRQRDCMSDYGKKTGSTIKIEKPLTFKYSSETTQDGKTMVEFPDCIVIGAKITLPPGVDSSRLAVQFDVNVLPAGKLKCIDPGTCNKDCYYCNFCNNTRKVDMVSNSNSPNLCNAKGGGVYQIETTVCPPPATFNKAVCSGMTKSDPTYWKKSGDVQGRILFWIRTPNEATAKQDFNYKLKTDTTGFVRKGWVVLYAADNKNLLTANTPTDFDLEEWYIHKYGGQDELVGCVEGTTNYTVSSSTVKTTFLLDAAATAADPQSLFDKKTCPQVDAINTAQAQQDMVDAAKKFTTKASPWGSLFGGRRRRQVQNMNIF